MKNQRNRWLSIVILVLVFFYSLLDSLDYPTLEELATKGTCSMDVMVQGKNASRGFSTYGISLDDLHFDSYTSLQKCVLTNCLKLVMLIQREKDITPDSLRLRSRVYSFYQIPNSTIPTKYTVSIVDTNFGRTKDIYASTILTVEPWLQPVSQSLTSQRMKYSTSGFVFTAPSVYIWPNRLQIKMALGTETTVKYSPDLSNWYAVTNLSRTSGVGEITFGLDPSKNPSAFFRAFSR